jgi:acylglycerol lipase
MLWDWLLEEPCVFGRKNLLGVALSVMLGANLAGFLQVASAAGSDEPKATGSAVPAQTAAGAEDSEGSKSLFGGRWKAALKVPNVPVKPTPTTSWLPEPGKTRVAMLCIHGFSLHKFCFNAFGKEMAKDGIATYAIDLRGFGESKVKTEHSSFDMDGWLVDIKAALEKIHQEQPGVPVLLLGESMGGAVALRAAALYPDLVSGLIASVPARDRFGMSEGEKKVTLTAVTHLVTGEFDKPITGAAFGAVQKISGQESLRAEWKNDPLMRTDFSAKEFVQFDEFMSGNLNAATYIKKTPVLFIQGTDDKLIRPEGTWKLYEKLATANRQLVLSKNAEHLIFEEGQFKPDDLRFVTTWIGRNVTPLDASIASDSNKLSVVASSRGDDTSQITNATTDGAAKIGNIASASTSIPPAPAQTEFKHKIASSSPQINFWIELNRDNKTFRCNNKMEFKTGDKIRFHLIPETDGYAYLVMKAGTTGKSDVLFPNAKYGTQNYLNHGKDYPIPAVGWMQFDQHPGTEQLGLVFANVKVDVTPETLKNRTLTAFVSHDQSGSKDLCPTRMKLSWDDPMPVMLPDDFSAISQVANAADSSLVRLGAQNGGMVSASISLLHNSGNR